MVNACPMCLKEYTSLNQHLLVTHKVWNKDERELLVKLAGGKIDVRLQKCPVPSCVTGKCTRLDRHMNTHKELSAASKDKMLKVVRKRLMLDTLAGLRATHPTVPMVSRLDLDQAEGLEWDEEQEEEQEEEEEEEEGEGLVSKLKRTIVSMNDALQVAHGYNRTLKRSYVALQRKNVKLQKKMQRFGPAEPLAPSALQTSEAGPFYSCQSTDFPDLNLLLECFKKTQEGPDPSPKLRNNVQSKLNRISTFVGWMIRDKTQLGRLQCLCDVDRLRGWVKSLRGCKLALTTTLQYLKNARQFLRFIQEMPPPSSSINKNDLKRVIKELTASIKSWNRPVVLHQLRVRENKDLHSIKDLQECRRLALVAIPKVISKLKKHHTTTDRNKLFGLVLAYLASLYGHQAGVFLSLTDEQVSKAVYGPKGNDYLIKVEENKTEESFGTAKMLLTDQEYGWLSFIISLKKKWAKGEVSKFLFFNTTFSQDMNLNKYLKSAWSNMQLSGEATFASLRSAVETFARDRHGEHSQKWKKMARLMCHDTKTSDKCYAMDVTMEQARKGRQLFEEAQEEEEGAEGEEDKDEEGEEDKDEGEERRTSRRRRERKLQPNGDKESEKVHSPVVPPLRRAPTKCPIASEGV